MSEPQFTSGETRKGTCEACGREVTQREFIGAYELKSRWSNESHEAPCGLPCFGAPIPGKIYKEARETGIHRKENCPKCYRALTPPEPPNTPEEPYDAEAEARTVIKKHTRGRVVAVVGLSGLIVTALQCAHDAGVAKERERVGEAVRLLLRRIDRGASGLASLRPDVSACIGCYATDHAGPVRVHADDCPVVALTDTSEKDDVECRDPEHCGKGAYQCGCRGAS